MSFPANQENAFAVVQQRNSGNGVPKVTKIVGELYTCPEQAAMARNAMNQDFDETGVQTPYSAVSLHVSFIRDIADAEPAAVETSADSYNPDDHEAFVEHISDMDAFDLLEIMLKEESVRQHPMAVEAIRQRDKYNRTHD